MTTPTENAIFAAAMEQLLSVEHANYHDEYNSSEFKKFLEQAANEEAALERKTSPFIEANNIDGIEKEMEEVLGKDRVTMIKNAFQIETFEMQLTEKAGSLLIKVIKDAKKFKDAIVIRPGESGIAASETQIISLVVEIFLFVLGAVGIRIGVNARQIRKLENDLAPLIKTPAFQKAIADFLKEWRKNGADISTRGKAIFIFLKDLLSGGLYWKVTNIIISDMSFLDRARALAQIAVLIVTAIKSGGAALIARILVSLRNASALAVKIANLTKLDEWEKKVVSD